MTNLRRLDRRFRQTTRVIAADVTNCSSNIYKLPPVTP